ncbi:MAG: hypothetical protein KKD05_02440, partial [Candidatus Omnitrophica bacterium]|nr:hypothetical protein [Candidatus Omnitrophota bacterium]
MADKKEEFNLKEEIEKGSLHCRVIIEILGKPKEHVLNTMKAVIEQMKDYEDLKLLKAKIFEPKEVESLWNVFTEAEIVVKDASVLIGFCFDYMPSSVEIIEPEHVSYKASELAGLINDMQARLHNVDMKVKNLTAENKILHTKVNSLVSISILIALRDGPKTKKEISDFARINEE